LYYAINGFEGMIKCVKGLLLVSVEYLPYETALWFLIVMFETVVGYAIIDKACKKTWIRRVVICLMAVLGTTWKILFDRVLPWGIQVTLVAVLFYEVGRYSHEKIIGLNNKMCVLIFSFSLIVWIPSVYINGQLNMRTSTYHIIPLSILAALAGTYIMYFISKYLSVLYIEKYLSHISTWAIWFIVINHIALWGVEKLILNACGYISVVSSVLIGIVSLIVIYTSAYAIYKTPLKYFLGNTPTINPPTHHCD
jgi:hypothetical protein